MIERGEKTVTDFNGSTNFDGSTNAWGETVAGAPPVGMDHCELKGHADQSGTSYDGSGCKTYGHTIEHSSQQDQMKWNLYTGGKSVTAAMKVLALSGDAIQIFQDGTWQYLPNSEFTIGGYTLDSDGLKIISAPGGQIMDVTPKARPNHYEGGPGVETPQLKICDANNNDLTQGTNTVVAGQQINLQCRLLNCPRPATNFQWTIPGFAISNYVASVNSGIVYTNFPTNGTNVTFYWVDGNSNLVVSCAATVGDQRIVGQARFNVVKPAAKITTYTNSVSFDPNYFLGLALHFGTPTPITWAGIICSNSVPLNLPLGYSGHIQWVQLINSTKTFSGNGPPLTTNNFGYDPNVYPYLGNTNWGYSLADSPGQAVNSSFTGLVRQDSFQDWLMFQADGVTSIPVPIRLLNRSWGGTAAFTNGYWSGSGSATVDQDTLTASPPQWSKYAH
jgi:hypothetical protein